MQEVRTAFPTAHVSCSVWQAARAAARLAAEAGALGASGAAGGAGGPATADVAARCKTYALALLRGDHTPAQLQVRCAFVYIMIHYRGWVSGKYNARGSGHSSPRWPSVGWRNLKMIFDLSKN